MPYFLPMFLTLALLGAISVGFVITPEAEIYVQPATPLSGVALAMIEPKPATNHGELLPDLVPLPPQDLAITRRADGALMLVFSTTYFNQGEGVVELIPDPKTKGISKDVERNIFQRIYKRDGDYRDIAVGTFLWHQTHLHYHYSDFAEYDLAAVSASNHTDLTGARAKATYCLRDVSRVELELEHRDVEAKYRICGKELQGVSVGWGDTYLYNYPDQGLNISSLASGAYRLTFYVNPLRKLEELKYGNNTASVLIELNVEQATVKILAEEPSQYPAIEHVYPNQVFD